MLNSAIAILMNYIDDVTPFNFYSLTMERGENGEDIYYLCEVGEDFYVVFETDYIDPRPYQWQEVAEIFVSIGVEPLGWLVKKTKLGEADTQLVAPNASIGEAPNYERLVSSSEGMYLRHAVLKMRNTKSSRSHYHPHAYGATTPKSAPEDGQE